MMCVRQAALQKVEVEARHLLDTTAWATGQDSMAGFYGRPPGPFDIASHRKQPQMSHSPEECGSESMAAGLRGLLYCSPRPQNP